MLIICYTIGGLLMSNQPREQIDKENTQNDIMWLHKKIHLNSCVDKTKNRQVEKGEVYTCNFGVGVGSEMQKLRPCVILQNNDDNYNSPNTIVAPITHDTDELDCMFPVSVKYDQNGNTILDGKVNVSNLMCVSKARLGKKITKLTPSEMKEIEKRLIAQMDINCYINYLKKQIKKKDEFISKVKEQNKQSSELIGDLMEIVGTDSKEELLEKVKKLLTTPQK